MPAAVPLGARMNARIAPAMLPYLADRPVNPSLRTKWRWITRFLVLVVFLAVLGAAYLIVHGYIHHENIGDVWNDVKNFF